MNVACRISQFPVSDVECGEKLQLNMEHIPNFAIVLVRRSTEYSISGIWVALPYLNDVESSICIKYDLSFCLSVLIVKARQTARSDDK